MVFVVFRAAATAVAIDAHFFADFAAAGHFDGPTENGFKCRL
jgi:hypothetical protein